MKRPLTPTGRVPGGASRGTRALGRWAALGATFSILATLLVLPAGAAAGCGEPGRIVDRGQWQSIRVPAFSAGGPAIVDYAIAAESPGLMLVTNGRVVARSTDGGCHWKETMDASTADALPGGNADIEIKTISMPEAASSPVLLLAEERVGGVVRPRIFRSTDAGATFSGADAGVLPAGKPETLRVAPGSPNVAYLGISHGDDLLDQIFATQDGGMTWTLRSDLTEAAKQQSISGFEVDPGTPTELWATGPTGAYHSSDGGRTFALVDDLAGQLTTPADVTRPAGGGPARIAFFRPLGSDMMVSMNGGGNWLSLGTPSGVDSSAHGSGLMELLVTTESGRAYLFLPDANAWVDLSAAAGSHDAEVGPRGETDYYVRTRTTIERYVGNAPQPPPEPRTGEEVIVPSIDDLPSLQQEPARLAGPREELVLKAGASRTLTYTLDLPKGQRPLDLFFLVDTTESMKNFIASLKLSIADIVNGLADAGIAAHVGLGEYRAYPDHFPPRPDEPNFVYQKRTDLSPDTAALRDALQALEYDGGGQYDAQLGALYQVATGAGQDIDPQGPAGRDVPPGQQPRFRKVAEQGGDPLRLVLNFSDEPFGRPNRNRGDIEDISDRGAITAPDIPTMGQVIGALNAQGIKHIGLELGRAPGTFQDLRRVSAGTNALAPSQGVDCDGDGFIDIAPATPLVCALGRDVDAVSNMAPAIVNLVRALPLKESPSMNVPQGAEVVSEVTPGSYDGIPLQAGQTLPFRVTYTCDRSQAGERFPVTLQASGTNEVLAQLRTAVRCAPLSAEDEEVTPPPPPSLLFPGVLIPILPPVTPPPAPIPLTELSSATSSQAQTQAQAQAQAAAAAQRQQQPQLAFVHAQRSRLEVAKQEEYEMSAFNRREPVMPPSLAFVAAVAAMSFAFGMAMKRKPAPARALARRR